MNKKLQKAINDFAKALHDTIMSEEGASYFPCENDAYMGNIVTELTTDTNAPFKVNFSIGKTGRLMCAFIYDADWYHFPLKKLFTDSELETLRQRVIDNSAAIKAEKIKRLEAEIEALKC